MMGKRVTDYIVGVGLLILFFALSFAPVPDREKFSPVNNRISEVDQFASELTSFGYDVVAKGEAGRNVIEKAIESRQDDNEKTIALELIKDEDFSNSVVINYVDENGRETVTALSSSRERCNCISGIGCGSNQGGCVRWSLGTGISHQCWQPFGGQCTNLGCTCALSVVVELFQRS